jgi:hypothetical protein
VTSVRIQSSRRKKEMTVADNSRREGLKSPFRVLLLLTAVLLLTVLAAPAQTHDVVVSWWKFDEGSGNTAIESMAGRRDNILNNHSWPTGVSGSGLHFDGFTTAIDVAPKDLPQIGPGFSIEAWIALQSRSGYFFGIDSMGRLGLAVSVWGNWETCQSEVRVPLRKWVHVVGTYDPQQGIKLYIDGKLRGQLPVEGQLTPTKDTGLRIGRNFIDRPPTSLVRPAVAFPAYYSFDGIIDELKIYNRTLAPEQVESAYRTFPSPADPILPARRWPILPQRATQFGAAYTELKLYPEWDALWRTGAFADVVVSFRDSPVHYVFWRGGNYGETMVTENGIWVGDQSFESHTKVGTAEHMNDKHNMYSHISIVENTDARIVLHWRYGLTDVVGDISMPDPQTGWGNWADEFFYIYPDGTSVRYGTIHGSAKHYSFTEPTVLIEPEKKPEDYISLQAVTIANSTGESRTYSWDPSPPTFPFPDLPASANVALLNVKSTYKPFYIYPPRTILGPYGWPPELRSEYSHFPVWDHWPVNQIPSDGRFALFPDHYGSAAIMSPDPRDAFVQGLGPAKSTSFLFGLTTKSAAYLASLDRSWLNPALLKIANANFTEHYDAGQRAYILTSKTGPLSPPNSRLDLTFEASGDSPAVNPAFVIQNWGDARVSIRENGKEMRSSTYRTGLVHRLDGTDLVIWLEKETIYPFRLSIQKMTT